MRDYKIVDMTENVKILSTNKDPSMLIKMQRDPRVKDVAEEMEHEAAIYKAIYNELSEKAYAKNAIPEFHGFSTHLGSALLCVGKEGPDFEDIGVENLSHELKMSAVSQAGLVHHDLALRNIFQSEKNPKQAKIIDFGRAEFTENQKLLQNQMEILESMLRISSNGGGVSISVYLSVYLSDRLVFVADPTKRH
jgi:hypothetical protein